MEASLIHNPIFQAIVAPLATTLVLAAIIRLAGGTERGGSIMGIAIAVGFLVSYVLIEGMPPFPPLAAKQKLFYLVIVGGVGGLVLDLFHRPPLWERLAILAFPAACLIWFAWRRLMAGPDSQFLLTLILLWAGSVLLLWRISNVAHGKGGLSASILVAVTAVGASITAFLGASLTLAMQCMAVAAAVGAIVVWHYGARLLNRQEGLFGAAAILGGAGALTATAGVMGLYTPQVSRLALALLLIVPFSDIIASRFPFGDNLAGRISPWILAIIAAILVMFAIGVAYLVGMP